MRCKLSKHYLTLVLCTTVSVAAGLSGVRSRSILFIASGIAMVNTETAEAIGLDYSSFTDLCEEVKETVTQESFD